MSEMTSGLVERIERTDGPCRELDAAIATHLGWADVHWNSFHGNYWSHDLVNDLVVMLPVPEWTASIDAAMTLVPKGMRWCVDTCDGTPRAFIELPHPYEGQPFWGKSATPALALCAAALRARAPLPAPPAKDTIV